MQRFKFETHTLNSVIGGKSAIDIPRLNIKTIEEAEKFINGYGFDLQQTNDLEKIWYFHRRALVLLEERLGFSKVEIPEILRERKLLQDIRKLLLMASDSDPAVSALQKWACAILRTIHVFVHSENDLFASFSEEIQKQILSPIQEKIFHDGTSGKTYLKSSDEKLSIPLAGFEVKPFKTSTSTVIKLLAKPDALAMSVFDKLGFRFISNSLFDSFRIVRLLVEDNLISFPHVIPEQSTNNLYPVDFFVKTCAQFAEQFPHQSPEEVTEKLEQALHQNKELEGLFRKENNFSGEDYRFIKFICRKLIKIQNASGSFTFFYPFEVQVMDQKSHEKVLSGPSEHQAYKERQKQAARKRIFP
jgi:uncharacterized protein (TIGR04562 family)